MTEILSFDFEHFIQSTCRYVRAWKIKKKASMRKLSEILAAVKDYSVKRVAVAAAEDPTVLDAIKMATEGNVATAVLVGDEKAIRTYAEETGDRKSVV